LIYIENTSLDPFLNLAYEEYILKSLNLDEDCLMLWRNDNSIIVGKHQNTIEEINEEYVKEKHIKVARRITGGGAVYHDLGNLNFSFILRKNVSASDMHKLGIPMVNALKKIGIDAELSGRNDITIDGKKVSGTAKAIHKDKLLYHGAILFNSNMEVLSKALRVKQNKIESKGIKSVSSRVANIKDYLKEDIDILEFKEILKDYFFPDGLKEYHLSDAELSEIKSLRDNKFSTWEYIYGSSPKFNFKNSKRFPAGEVEVFLLVEHGFITKCNIYGDFLGESNIDLNELFIGKKYERDEILNVLNQFKEKQLFGDISNEEILGCFFD